MVPRSAVTLNSVTYHWFGVVVDAIGIFSTRAITTGIPNSSRYSFWKLLLQSSITLSLLLLSERTTNHHLIYQRGDACCVTLLVMSPSALLQLY